MQPNNDAELLTQLRDSLVPRGTAELVRLSFEPNGAAYVATATIAACLATLEYKARAASIAVRMGDDAPVLNALEKLGLMVLTDSAGIKTD